jgi:hypothetical protein
MKNNKKTWFDWILIWTGCYQLGSWVGYLIGFLIN